MKTMKISEILENVIFEIEDSGLLFLDGVTIVNTIK